MSATSRTPSERHPRPGTRREPSFLRGRAAGKTPMPLRPTRPREEASVDAPLRAGHTPRRVPLYRRRAVKPRPRRHLGVLRWLRPLLTAILLVGAVAAAIVWMAVSPRFQISAVEVRGDDPALTAWVEQRVAPFAGRPLLLLPLDRVTAAVGAHPWIDTLEVSRLLPDRLSVEIHERRPAAVMEIRGPGATRELMYADREGRAIAPVDAPGAGAPDPEVLARLLRVSGGAPDTGGVPEALEIRRELQRAHPGWAEAVTRVEVLGENDFRLHTASLPFSLAVRSGEVGPKIRWLERLLPRLVERWGEPGSVDLRFARRIVMERVVVDMSDRSPDRGA